MIEGCLRSLMKWAWEIVLVDSGSKDKTLEIARKYGCKIYQRRFDDFASQKNFALSKTSGEWVLSIDADERIPEELAEEISLAIQSEKYQGYLIPRRNFILGGEIKHSRWSPDKHVWLWKKGYGRWVGEVHEEVVVDGNVTELKSAKLHYQDKTVKEFIRTNNHYSTLLSQKMYDSGIRFSFLRMVKATAFEFIVRFFYKLGFLDGWRGVVLAVLMAYYQLQVWLKLYRLQKGVR